MASDNARKPGGDSLFAARRSSTVAPMSVGHTLPPNTARVVQEAIKRGNAAAMAQPPPSTDKLTNEEENALLVWSTEPAFEEQFSSVEHRGSWKLTNHKVEVLDLDSQEGLKRYNELLCLSEPKTAPKIVMVERLVAGVTATGSVIKVIVQHHTVLYRNPNKPLISNLEKNDAATP